MCVYISVYRCISVDSCGLVVVSARKNKKHDHHCGFGLRRASVGCPLVKKNMKHMGHDRLQGSAYDVSHIDTARSRVRLFLSLSLSPSLSPSLPLSRVCIRFLKK